MCSDNRKYICLKLEPYFTFFVKIILNNQEYELYLDVMSTHFLICFDISKFTIDQMYNESVKQLQKRSQSRLSTKETLVRSRRF